MRIDWFRVVFSSQRFKISKRKEKCRYFYCPFAGRATYSIRIPSSLKTEKIDSE